ncbi:unnamed protein product [Lactuca virosa]|uniref:FLZ-type domain-containing protein n=1 Tax=Lactuca virosa TaxID=75947 RepID=A0AAU9NCR0_9ASTR|nr:unnamed protein product [Lactuca virosa]
MPITSSFRSTHPLNVFPFANRSTHRFSIFPITLTGSSPIKGLTYLPKKRKSLILRPTKNSPFVDRKCFECGIKEERQNYSYCRDHLLHCYHNKASTPGPENYAG